MAIDFKPFEELFASEYQLTYISTNGHIDVGPNTYSVFHSYTMIERQVIFQVCEKHLPWEYTEEQEQWERTMYMYKFVIKSPPPFPYEEYPLSEGIIMAITWTPKITVMCLETRLVSLSATRLDSDDPDNPKTYTVYNMHVNTQEEKLAVMDAILVKRAYELIYEAKVAIIAAEVAALEAQAKTYLESQEI